MSRFDWDAQDAQWQTMFTELKRYRERFGDCNVPQKWKENPQLGSWVNNHRTAYGYAGGGS
jgi:hypothetical protein